jgi:uncharacterized membrane protein
MRNFKKLKQTHYIFAFVALVFGLFFVRVIPPLWGLDEPSHFYRTYQIAHGHFLPERSKDNLGGEVPQNLYDLGNYSIGDLVDNNTNNIIARQDVDSRAAYEKYTNDKFSTRQHNAPSTSSYSPIAYAAPAIGVMIARIFNLSMGHTLLLARVFSLLLYIIIVAYALRAIKDSKVKWIVFIVALFPAALFQACVITADGLTIALSLLFVSLLFKVMTDQKVEHKKTLLAAIGITAILLPLVKLNYIFLSIGIVLIPNTAIGTKRIALLCKTAVLTVSAMLTVAWAIVSKVTATQVSQRPDGVQVVISDQIAFVLGSPFHFLSILARTLVINSDAYMTQMLTMVGWNYITPPLVYVVILVLAVFVAVLYCGDEVMIMRKKLTMLSLFVGAGIASIFFTLYVAFTPYKSLVIEGVQGRYIIPFLVPILLFVASIVPVSLNMKEKATQWVFIAPSVICLLATSAYYYLATY